MQLRTLVTHTKRTVRKPAYPDRLGSPMTEVDVTETTSKLQLLQDGVWVDVPTEEVTVDLREPPTSGTSLFTSDSLLPKSLIDPNPQPIPTVRPELQHLTPLFADEHTVAFQDIMDVDMSRPELLLVLRRIAVDVPKIRI